MRGGFLLGPGSLVGVTCQLIGWIPNQPGGSLSRCLPPPPPPPPRKTQGSARSNSGTSLYQSTMLFILKSHHCRISFATIFWFHTSATFPWNERRPTRGPPCAASSHCTARCPTAGGGRNCASLFALCSSRFGLLLC